MAGRAKHVSAQEADDVDGTWEIPSHWTWQKIEDVAEINPKTSLGDLPATHPVPFIPMASVSEESGAIDASQRRDAAAVQKGYTRFKSGDVIFAKITPCMENGKIAIVPALPDGVAAGSTEFHVLRPNGVDPHYLFYFLVRRAYREEARRNMSGSAGQLRVPLDFLRTSPIPVPPPDEQHQVCTRIGALFSDIADGEQALAEAREGLNTYRASLLNAAVTGELTAEWRRKNPPTETGADLLRRILADRRARWEADPRNEKKRYTEAPSTLSSDLPALPSGWIWSTVIQLSVLIRNGLSTKPTGDGAGIPILRISAVRPMEVDDTEIRWLKPRTDVRGMRATNGDLLVTRYSGSPKYVGVGGIFRGDDPIAYPDKLIRVVISGDEVLSSWVEMAINCGASRAFIELNTRTTAGQHGVSGETIGATPIPLPPECEMKQALASFRTRTLALNQSSEELPHVECGKNLRQSILSAAFRGELV